MRCCSIYSSRKINFKKQTKSLSTVSKSSLWVWTSVSVCICFLVLCFSEWLWPVNICFFKISQYVKLESRQVETLCYLMAYQQIKKISVKVDPITTLAVLLKNANIYFGIALYVSVKYISPSAIIIYSRLYCF